MASWIYLFSKFTPEALLFEALFIFTLCGGYAAFWILRKRRLGVIEHAVPAGVVKVYLNELIGDAEAMRAQLFGLLRNAGVQMPAGGGHGMSAAALAGAVAGDPSLLAKMAALEAKMAEQAKAMQAMLAEKDKIEKELAALKAGKGGAAPAAAGSKDLEDKIKLLEAKLAEYSIIEDDLANLKKLQQENAQLRAAMGGAPPPVAAAAPPAPAPPPEPAPVAAAEPDPVPEAPAAALPVDDVQAGVDALLAGTEAPAAPVEVDAQSKADALFDNLVDQVESSLQPEAPAAPAAAAPAAPAADPTLADKSDADLVAEFEKMLST